MSIFDRVGEKISKVDNVFNKVNHYEKKVSHLINDPIGTLTGSSKLGPLSSGELALLLSRPDPIVSFNWAIEMPTITAARSYSLNSEYVEACSIVLPDFGIRQVREFGRMMSYPEASPSMNTLQLRFYADVQNTALSYINAWRTLVHPVAGAFGTPNKPSTSSISGYKQQITMYTKDSYNERVFALSYIGCWPTAVESTTDTNSENDRISFIVTFAVDDVILSGYNIDTITNTIKTTITGVIKGVANSVVDSVKDIGKSAIGAFTKPLKDAGGRIITSGVLGIMSGGMSGGDSSNNNNNGSGSSGN